MDTKGNNNGTKNDHLKFFEPVSKSSKASTQSVVKSNIIIGIFGATVGLIASLIASMMSSTLSIIVFAFIAINPFFVMFPLFIMFTIILFYVSKKIYNVWEHTDLNKKVFITSYFTIYILMFLYWIF